MVELGDDETVMDLQGPVQGPSYDVCSPAKRVPCCDTCWCLWGRQT